MTPEKSGFESRREPRVLSPHGHQRGFGTHLVPCPVSVLKRPSFEAENSLQSHYYFENGWSYTFFCTVSLLGGVRGGAVG